MTARSGSPKASCRHDIRPMPSPGSIARAWLGLTDHNTAQDARTPALGRQFCSNLPRPFSITPPRLKALLNVSVADTDWANSRSDRAQTSPGRLFSEISRLQARTGRSLSIVDDAQWCDPETLQLLAEVACHVPNMAAGLILLERAWRRGRAPRPTPYASAIQPARTQCHA